jgi:hypothetical protein
MQRLILFLALLPGLAQAGAMQAPVSSSDAVDRAEAALMDGDFQRAASLASNASGPQAARILGEALEAQGDLKGAASAYAEAAESASKGSAWLQKKAQSLQAAAAAAAVQPTASPTNTPTAQPTAMPTASPTPTATAVPTPQATAAVTLPATPEPTPKPSPVIDDQARLDLEKEKAELARQRQDLDDQKARLAQEREDLQKEQATKGVSRSQGLTFYVGAGAYSPKAVEKFNNTVSQQQGGSSGGDTAQVHFSVNKAVGLRWEGFAIEGEFLEQSLSYTNSQGQPQEAKVSLDMVSVGYDWAFIRRGTLLGPVELALPLRVELGQVSVASDGQNYSTGPGGPAFGLSLRCWATPRFLIEAQALYHVNIHAGGDYNGGQNGGNSGNNNGGQGNGSGSGGQQDTEDLTQEGFEARLSLGWRLF